MNSEQIKSCAAAAMADFTMSHDEGCFLCVENSAVHAYPLKECPGKCPRVLRISKQDAKMGFTSRQWTAIGTELLNQYNKEVACQAHQKHKK